MNEAGRTGVVTDRNGIGIHPSVISFVDTGEVIVGADAKPRRVVDPRNTVYSFKRLMGQTATSVATRQFRARVPFAIEESPSNNLPMIQTRAGGFSPIELSAIMLDHLRGLATARVQRQVTHAVITVPANFNDAQRSATASAGAIAGLEIVRVLNEPTAAALAYGATRQLNETIAVFDFGGGTFDLTVMKLENNTYTVLGTAGDSFLGGDDIDERIVELMLAQVIHDHRVDLRDDIFAMMKLRSIAEEIKIALSTQGRQKIVVPDLGLGAHGEPITLEFTLTHAELVELMGDLVDRAMSVTRDALSIAQVKTERITDVILVGGTTRIPFIRNRVATFFERAARTDVSPEDAVAIGAALQAASLDLVLDEPASISTSSTKSGYERVEKLPATVAPPQAIVDIDDAIAATDLPVLDIDEAIEQVDWSPNEKSVDVALDFDLKTPPPPIPRRVVIDVTPNSFGVGTLGGFCEILISRSSPLPVMIKKSYATVRDAQEAVRIVVCQGEARKLASNVVLGDVVLDNLPKLPRGDVEIEVAFVLDQSGMLQVSARDAKSGHTREVQLDLIGRMSDTELAAARDRMSRLGLGKI